MSDSIQWMKLVGQGRAKAYGVPWLEVEVAELAKVSGAEKEALIAKFRTGKVEEPKVETPEVPIEEPKEEEPVAEPKAKRSRKPKK